MNISISAIFPKEKGGETFLGEMTSPKMFLMAVESAQLLGARSVVLTSKIRHTNVRKRLGVKAAIAMAAKAVQ